MDAIQISDEKNARKRRKSAYSRKGCLQCKKAHTKCDERKPKCTRCIRRAIECVYKNNIVLQSEQHGNGVGWEENSQIYGHRHNLVNSGVFLTASRPSFSNASSFLGSGMRPGIPGPYLSRNGVVLPPLQLEPNYGNNNNNNNVDCEIQEEQGSFKGQGAMYVGGGQRLQHQPIVIQNQLHSQPHHHTQKGFNNVVIQNADQFAPLRIYGSSATSAGGLVDTISPNSRSNIIVRDHINIREYVYISREDWNCINYLKYAQGPQGKRIPTMTERSDFNQTSSLFQFSWRNMSSSDFEKVLNEFDPIQQLYLQNNVNFESIVQLNELKILEFCWSLMRCGAIGHGIAFFPYETHLDPLLRIFFSMCKSYPLMNDVFIYASAVFMRDVYANLNLHHFSYIWDRQVRIPALKRCLDQLEILIHSSRDFCDNVVFTFTISSLLFVEGMAKSLDWRMHFRKVRDMLKKVDSLKPQAFDVERIYFTANECLMFLKDWFCRLETLAWMSADNSGCIENEHDLNEFLYNGPYSKFSLLNETYDLQRGYTIHFYPLFTKISGFLLRKKKDGILLTGTNIMKLLFTKIDESLSADLSRFGDEILLHLRNIPMDDEHLNKVTYGLDDLRLKLSLKNCTRMYHTALELYLEIFFIRKPITKNYYGPRIEKMVEHLFSIPYHTTCSIACHWPIYIGAIVSLLMKEQNLFEHFMLVLGESSSSGTLNASRSVEKLTFISEVLACGNYNDLVNPNHDYIVC